MSEYDMLPAAVPFVTIENGQQRYAPQNDGITPIFFHSTVQNFAKTETEGRPIFDEFEFCRILIAGDPHNAHVEPVTDAVKRRFAAQYHEWKLGNEQRQQVTGTPLRQWPLMTPAKIAEFEALHIYNVEGLAQLAEVHLQRGFDLREWRERARAWLESAKDGSAAARYAAENEKLRGDLGRVTDQVAVLTDQIAKLTKAQEAERHEGRRR
jgi:hypothetical protein